MIGRRTLSSENRSTAQFRRREGAVTVEFALVTSLFFVFCFAAIEFARVNIVRHLVDTAAYEAARVGIVPGATVADVQAQANQHLTITNLQGATVAVVPDPIVDSTDAVTVTITVPMDQNTWVLPSFTTGAQIVSSSTLRAERYRGIPGP